MKTNRSAPAATVVPILIYSDVGQAIAWLSDAFGFSERLRAERGGVVGHAQLVVGDGALMLGRSGGEYRPPVGGAVHHAVHVTVADVDTHFERAQSRGARIIDAPHDMPFGERQYTAEDFAGHRWTFSQHVADVAPEEWGAKVAQ
jgi:uncharacterized glyoxalase superfamily protein PhnB